MARPNKYGAKKAECLHGHTHDSNIRERFRKFTLRAENGCLEWQGGRTKEGYGLFYVQLPNHHRTAKAHRIAWEIYNNASLLPGALVRHKCDNPRCVDGEHLEVGSAADNVRDSIERGRFTRKRGEDTSFAQLTAAQVIEARKRFAGGEPIPSIASEYGVKYPALYNAVRGRSWAWL